MANDEFAKALEFLRKKYNLTQTVVAEIAGIIQSDYSAFERQKRQLNLNDANKISLKVWGVPYNRFVEFSKETIILENLPKATQLAIEARINKRLRSSESILANSLDKLIVNGFFNTPKTSKLAHQEMGEEVKDKATSEITSLLGRSPRNKTILSLKEPKSPKIFVHKDHISKYEAMSKEELDEIILKEEVKLRLDKKTEGE